MSSSPSVDQVGQGTSGSSGYKITEYAKARVIELAREVELLFREQSVHAVSCIAMHAESARLWCVVPLKDRTGPISSSATAPLSDNAASDLDFAADDLPQKFPCPDCLGHPVLVDTCDFCCGRGWFEE